MVGGAVAQLGERRVRNAEVGSSILLGSTSHNAWKMSCFRNFGKSSTSIGVNKQCANALDTVTGVRFDELFRQLPGHQQIILQLRSQSKLARTYGLKPPALVELDCTFISLPHTEPNCLAFEYLCYFQAGPHQRSPHSATYSSLVCIYSLYLDRVFTIYAWTLRCGA